MENCFFFLLLSANWNNQVGTFFEHTKKKIKENLQKDEQRAVCSTHLQPEKHTEKSNEADMIKTMFKNKIGQNFREKSGEKNVIIL